MVIVRTDWYLSFKKCLQVAPIGCGIIGSLNGVRRLRLFRSLILVLGGWKAWFAGGNEQLCRTLTWGFRGTSSITWACQIHLKSKRVFWIVRYWRYGADFVGTMWVNLKMPPSCCSYFRADLNSNGSTKKQAKLELVWQGWAVASWTLWLNPSKRYAMSFARTNFHFEWILDVETLSWTVKEKLCVVRLQDLGFGE